MYSTSLGPLKFGFNSLVSNCVNLRETSYGIAWYALNLTFIAFGSHYDELINLLPGMQ